MEQHCCIKQFNHKDWLFQVQILTIITIITKILTLNRCLSSIKIVAFFCGQTIMGFFIIIIIIIILSTQTHTQDNFKVVIDVK